MIVEEEKVLGIISAAKCNLNCSYCYLHKNNSYLNEDKLISEAMRDGTYINNIKRTLIALKENINNFITLEFWGAETSYHFSDRQDFFEELIHMLPNLRKINYSTNFMTGYQKQLDFINIIEKAAINDIDLMIQISTDGPDSILQLTRHYNYENLRKEVFSFIKELNTRKLRKTRINLIYKSTLPWSIYKDICSEDKKILEYLNFFVNECNDIQDLNLNQNVSFDIGSIFGPSLEYPYPYTVKDGIDMAHFANKCERMNLDKIFNRAANLPLLTTGFVEEEEKSLYGPKLGCGQMFTNYLFRYDGTMSPCSNGFMDRNIDNQNFLKDNDPKEYERVMKTKNFGINETINGVANLDSLLERISYISKFWKYHGEEVVRITNALMFELAYAGQISKIYLNEPSLRYKHSLFIVKRNSCYFQNLRSTGSPYVPDDGLIKLYCNGLGEFYEIHKRMVL